MNTTEQRHDILLDEHTLRVSIGGLGELDRGVAQGSDRAWDCYLQLFMDEGKSYSMSITPFNNVSLKM